MEQETVTNMMLSVEISKHEGTVPKHDQKLTRYNSTLQTSYDADKASNVKKYVFSKDIFCVYGIAKAYKIWDKLSDSDQRKYKRAVYLCAMIQVSLYIFMFVELFLDWDNRITSRSINENTQKHVVTLIIQFLTLFVVSCYLSIDKETYRVWFHAARNVAQFENSYTAAVLYMMYNYSLFFIALFLSIALVFSAESGFDSVLNAVGVLFVLDLDNYGYIMLRSHPNIRDEMFEIEIPANKYSLYHYISNAQEKYFGIAAQKDCCFEIFSRPILYFWRGSVENNKQRIKGRIPSLSGKLGPIRKTLIFSFAVAFIFVGYRYQELSALLYVGLGIIILGIVAGIYWKLIHCRQRCLSYKEQREDVNNLAYNILPLIYDHYYLEYISNPNVLLLQDIKDSLLDECFEAYKKEKCFWKLTRFMKYIKQKMMHRLKVAPFVCWDWTNNWRLKDDYYSMIATARGWNVGCGDHDHDTDDKFQTKSLCQSHFCVKLEHFDHDHDQSDYKNNETKGKYYYEAVLGSDMSKLQIGFCGMRMRDSVDDEIETKEFELSDDHDTDYPIRTDKTGKPDKVWVFDAFQQLAVYVESIEDDEKNVRQVDYGEKWKKGDTLQCLLDVDTASIEFMINNQSLGVGFDNISKGETGPLLIYPCIGDGMSQQAIGGFIF